MKTKTCRTYVIAKNAPSDDAGVIQYWLSLSNNDQSLFDNVSDFLMAVSAVK